MVELRSDAVVRSVSCTMHARMHARMHALAHAPAYSSYFMTVSAAALSKPLVGSSRKSTDGAASTPAAMPSLLRSPPDMPRRCSPPGSCPPICMHTAATQAAQGHQSCDLGSAPDMLLRCSLPSRGPPICTGAAAAAQAANGQQSCLLGCSPDMPLRCRAPGSCSPTCMGTAKHNAQQPCNSTSNAGPSQSSHVPAIILNVPDRIRPHGGCPPVCALLFLLLLPPLLRACMPLHSTSQRVGLNQRFAQRVDRE